MNEFVERRVCFTWRDLAPTYDVIIVGGGGHGLATAYYLATRHGIRNVAVLERDYIGGGNSGRNTTVIRANYGLPETVRFYKHSVDLYRSLEQETGRWVMHEERGLLWLAHSPAVLLAEQGRAEVNRAFGAHTEFVERQQIGELCPLLDLDGGGRWPILGGSYHPGGATARHDRVNWAFAEGAMEHGVTVVQRCGVEKLLHEGGKVTGVRTAQGDVHAPIVLSAVGGDVSPLLAPLGLRLPIRTHPLQAMVTQHYQRALGPIVMSADLGFYVSQTARGEMLMGAMIDRQPSYSRRSGEAFLAETCRRAMTLLPCLGDLRVLRQWAGICDMSPDDTPILGRTPIDGLMISTGWGTWGFKAIPASGEQLAQLIATGEVPELIAPFGLDRFERDRTLPDRGSSGTH